jgi:hypothetical protein
LGQLDEVGLTERRDDGVEVELEEREEGIVRDVSRRDDEYFPRRPPEQVAVAEVLVLVTMTRFSVSACCAI